MTRKKNCFLPSQYWD